MVLCPNSKFDLTKTYLVPVLLFQGTHFKSNIQNYFRPKNPLKDIFDKTYLNLQNVKFFLTFQKISYSLKHYFKKIGF